MRRAGWGLALLLLPGSLAAWLLWPRPSLPPAPVVWPREVVLEEGDLLFLRTQSMAGRLVIEAEKGVAASATGRDLLLTHVGLVVIEGEGKRVIHADPGSQEQGPARIRSDRLEDFCREASVVALYRCREASADQRALAGARAQIFFREGRLFDGAFDAGEGQALYCTELVWLAWKEAGIELVSPPFDQVRLGWFEREVLLPSRLANSPRLDAILTLPRKE